MKTSTNLTLAEKILAVTPIAMVVAISPWQTLDSINLPKFLILVTGAAALLGTSLVGRAGSQTFSAPKVAIIISIAMVISMLLTIIFSDAPIIQQLYGAYGRNTGFIAYASFILFWIMAIAHATDLLIEKVLKYVILSGQITLIYCIIQYLGLDPVSWNNSYSPILGFLGNPNFASAFLGISSVAAMAMIVGNKIKSLIGIISSIFVIFSLILIILSKSQQGLFVFGSGVFVIFAYRIYSQKSKSLFLTFISIGFISSVVSILGMLKIGPLSNILYQESTTYRGDYWQAAIQMVIKRPLTGVGLDSYGDWYRRARSVDATIRRGPDVVTNAAHNVYLDILSTGGFILFFAYAASVVFVVVSILRIVKEKKQLPPALLGIIACWVSFQVQSIVSINQLGLAIWGWIFGGLIIGYAHKPDVKKPSPHFESRISDSPQIVMAFVGFLIGFLISVPPFYASAKFKASLELQNANLIFESAKLFPRNPITLTSAATIFAENKLSKQTVELLNLSKKNFPSDFQTWNLISSSIYFDQNERERALMIMKTLDPHNENIDKEQKLP